MPWLILVSLIWAFSFGMIKTGLIGVDSYFVAMARLTLSFLFFLPFWRPKKAPLHLGWKLFGIGLVQFGLMYVAYLASFSFLKAHEVALFTILTPLYVTGIHAGMSQKFHRHFFLTSGLAVLGSGVLLFDRVDPSGIYLGFFLVQISNICFAFGQIAYRRVMASNPALKDQTIFGYLYLGGWTATGLFSIALTDWKGLSLNVSQVMVLLYLGLIASGMGFFLWNLGAKKVNAGVLAIANNFKIPLGMFVAFIVFHETGSILRLVLGSGILFLALVLNHRFSRQT